MSETTLAFLLAFGALFAVLIVLSRWAFAKRERSLARIRVAPARLTDPPRRR